MPAERGEYRGIYVVIVDGPNFQTLTPDGKLVWYTLKLGLGPYGIDAIAGASAALAERTGLSLGQAEAALAELEHEGWIERERSLLWLVRGLEFEPSLSPSHPNHREGLRKHLAGLPNLTLKQRFRARYAEWFPSEVSPSPKVSGNGLATGSGGPAEALPIREEGGESQQEISSSPSSKEAVVPIDRTDYTKRCTIACNRGLRDNPRVNGIRELMTSNQMVEVGRWLDARIPIDLAERVVYDKALAYEPAGSNRQPSSLRYFRRPVEEAFEREEGRAQERRFTPRAGKSQHQATATKIRRLV
jgi:hypothetical protein